MPLAAKKKKANPQKKRIIEITALLGLLGGFALLMIFVTLPAMGVELFKSDNRSTRNKTVSSSGQTTTKPAPDTGSSDKSVGKIDEDFLKAALNEKEGEKAEYYNPEIFKPYYFDFDNEEVIDDFLLSNETDRVREHRDAIFLSFFLDKDGNKTAWIKTYQEPNKVYELTVNSKVPNVPYPLQVIDITKMGILLYRYPDMEEKEREKTPRLYRILARPYLEMTELKAKVKTE